MQHLRKNNILFFILAVLYKFMLEYAYSSIVTVRFAYDGYFTNFELSRYLISWLFFFFGFGLVRNKVKDVTDFFFITAFVHVLVPMDVLIGMDSKISIFPLIICNLTILALRLITFPNYNFGTYKLKNLRKGKEIATTLSVCFVIFLVFWYSYANVNLNLNLDKVYDFRNENKEIAASGGIIKYIVSWTYQVFNIFLIIIFIQKRKWFYLVVALTIQVYFFAASAHKSVLFYPILVIFARVYFVRFKNLNLYFILNLFVIAIPILTYQIFNDIFTSSYILRRVTFLPAKLTYTYFDFFEQNSKIYWSNSFLSNFIDYPYNEVYKEIIAANLGYLESSANNGFISTGYANAGLLGIIFYILILGGTLILIKNLSKEIPIWISIALTIIPFRSLLISSDLLTVFLTHGFIFVIIFLFMIRKNLTHNYR